MIKKAIEGHSYALARGIEELHQHTERMQDAVNDARLTIRNADYRDGKLSAHEMLRYTVNMDIAENEYREAQAVRSKIDRLLSSLNAELQSIQEVAVFALNADGIEADMSALDKEFKAKGGEHFFEEAKKLSNLKSGKPWPKGTARLLWEAYGIPIIGNVTFETALKCVLERHGIKQKKGGNV
ncbi:MAG: hypothetical protein E7597_03945 [Ruminococcaceae bacterium]|nr:hypothetical protein [Oscillospiraceae bacterium]